MFFSQDVLVVQWSSTFTPNNGAEGTTVFPTGPSHSNGGEFDEKCTRAACRVILFFIWKGREVLSFLDVSIGPLP